MWRKIWIAWLVFGALHGACSGQKTEFPASGEWKRGRQHMPGSPRATLLVGVPPFFLSLAHEHENLRLLPEPGQPSDSGNQPAIYPSLSRDGKVAAYAAMRWGPGNRVAITTYSLVDHKRTVYAEGDYAGAFAISPDAIKLAFFDRKNKEHPEGDNHLHGWAGEFSREFPDAVFIVQALSGSLHSALGTLAVTAASWRSGRDDRVRDFRGVSGRVRDLIYIYDDPIKWTK